MSQHTESDRNDSSQHHPTQPSSVRDTDPRPASPHASAAPGAAPSTAAPVSAPSPSPATDASAAPSAADIKRWRQYLADERAEAAVYRDLAQNRAGEERAILLALAEAEGRHEAHWLQLLGDHAGKDRHASLRSRFLGFLARHFGSVFVLALAQRAESRSPYATESFATPAMVADEQIHEEVVRGLATRGRNRLAGTFRAAVFGANDGLVSNLSLVMGMAASGVGSQVVLLSGVAGLLAGALSMGAGEFISVRSQRELLAATRPTQITLAAAPLLDIEHNELLLVYLARGMSREAAEHRVAERMGLLDCDCDPSLSLRPELPESRGPARGGRHRLGRGGVELLLLRLRRDRAHHSLPAGHDRTRRTGGFRRPSSAWRCCLPAASWACSPAPRPPPVACASWPSAWVPRA